MAKSALLKSSIGKKYWMALTGLFLCTFLLGHMAGNLQLLVPDNALNFNKYALFMTTNPVVKLLSYVTYFSIIFHAVDGIILTIQNNRARPIGYAKNNPSANSSFPSRNMAVLGTLILVFLAVHMTSFWGKMHFDKNMPIQKTTINVAGQKQDFYLTTDGGYIPVNDKNFVIKNRTEFFDANANVKVKEGYKDLYKLTFDAFRDPKYGLLFTLFYVFSMIVMGFHLWHGFQSGFQTLGANHPKYTPMIKWVGRGFATVVPFLFAIIPLYIHFSK